MAVPPSVCGRVTVQVLEEPAASADGAHTTDRTPGAVVKLITASCHELLSDALSRAVWSAAIGAALIENVRVVVPAGTVTVAGTIRDALSLVRLTVPPELVHSVTVHVPAPSGPSVVGAQEIDVTRAGDVRSMGMLTENPFSDAVTVASSSAVIVPAVTTKAAVVAPAAMTAAAGAASEALLLDRLTEAPPLLDRLTEHVACSPLCSAMGEHVSDVITIAGVKLIVTVREDPFTDAATVTVCSPGRTLAAVTVNVAVVAPAATVTDPGANSNELLLEMVSDPLPALDSVTVHVLEPDDDRVAGVQASDVIVIGTFRGRDVDMDEPFSAAVIVADCSVLTLLIVTTNVATVALIPTETDCGTVAAG